MKAIFAVLVAFLLWWAGFELGKSSGRLEGTQEMAPKVYKALEVAKEWEEIAKKWESNSNKFESGANTCLTGYRNLISYAKTKLPKLSCAVQGELLVIDGLMEGFKNAERNGDEPSWKGIQERLREARRLILSQEWQ